MAMTFVDLSVDDKDVCTFMNMTNQWFPRPETVPWTQLGQENVRTLSWMRSVGLLDLYESGAWDDSDSWDSGSAIPDAGGAGSLEAGRAARAAASLLGRSTAAALPQLGPARARRIGEAPRSPSASLASQSISPKYEEAPPDAANPNADAAGIASDAPTPTAAAPGRGGGSADDAESAAPPQLAAAPVDFSPLKSLMQLLAAAGAAHASAAREPQRAGLEPAGELQAAATMVGPEGQAEVAVLQDAAVEGGLQQQQQQQQQQPMVAFDQMGCAALRTAAPTPIASRTRSKGRAAAAHTACSSSTVSSTCSGAVHSSARSSARSRVAPPPAPAGDKPVSSRTRSHTKRSGARAA
jgi:hypothetical protein